MVCRRICICMNKEVEEPVFLAYVYVGRDIYMTLKALSHGATLSTCT